MKNNNVFYSCPYCKEEYTEPADLAHCILSCEEKAKQEAEAKKQAKLAAEKEARKSEIEAIENKLGELISAYIKDYGPYRTKRAYNENGFPYLWHMFF